MICVLLSTILALVFVSAYFSMGTANHTISTEYPSQSILFIRPALAESTSTFLEQEAGISIYINTGTSLSLSLARATLKTVEYNSSNYVIGSIAVPTYPSGTLSDTEDAHCFVHKDGWIVVYYLKGEPISKIVDWSWWVGGQLTKNKLQAGLEKMCTALGVPASGAKYYDFGYPSANKLMLVIRAQGGGETRSFNIKLPIEFQFYEQSWSHYAAEASGYYPAWLHIDGDEPPGSPIFASAKTTYGELSSMLAPNVFHKVEIYGTWGSLIGACIVLAYQE
jgi:hypothetical protein